MKLGQLIKYPREIFFLKDYAENEAGELVPVYFLVFYKSVMLGESMWSAA